MSEEQSIVSYRSIEGFPGYRVGDDGSVWSCLVRINTTGKCGIRYELSEQWRRMNWSPRCHPYPWVFLSGKNARGGRRKAYVHHLVLTAFVGPRPAQMQACHNDGDRANPSLSNLRWDTRQSNAQDRLKHGTQVMGERARLAKLTEGSVREIRSLFSSGSRAVDLASQFGVKVRQIYSVVRRESWKHVTA